MCERAELIWLQRHNRASAVEHGRLFADLLSRLATKLVVCDDAVPMGSSTLASASSSTVALFDTSWVQQPALDTDSPAAPLVLLFCMRVVVAKHYRGSSRESRLGECTRMSAVAAQYSVIAVLLDPISLARGGGRTSRWHSCLLLAQQAVSTSRLVLMTRGLCLWRRAPQLLHIVKYGVLVV